MYHITSRGNGGNKIFQDDSDHLIFLEELKKERFAGRPTLEEIFKEKKEKVDRNFLIHESFKKYGYTQTEIEKSI